MLGFIDIRNESFVAGWAANDENIAVDVTIIVGDKVFHASPTVLREDLAKFGLPPLSGFAFDFPTPLGPDDKVRILFPDGSEIPGSDPGLVPNFCDKFPSHQNAIDIFENTWMAAMPANTGLRAGWQEELFSDRRVTWGASVLRGLAGKSVLELGPFEGYNTRQFEQMGARTVAIEGNTNCFLRCLVVKNIFQLSATFLLGDIIKFTSRTDQHFDICWASGVLYHSQDPISLLDGICRVSDTIFIWTVYFDQNCVDANANLKRQFIPSKNRVVNAGGREATIYYSQYFGGKGPLFSGGSEAFAYWMTKEDIFSVITSYGFDHVVMGADDPAGPRGPACYFLASKSPFPDSASN